MAMSDIEMHITVRIELLDAKIIKQYNMLDVMVNAPRRRDGLPVFNIWNLYKNYVDRNHDYTYMSEAVDAHLDGLYTHMVDRQNYQARLAQLS